MPMIAISQQDRRLVFRRLFSSHARARVGHPMIRSGRALVRGGAFDLGAIMRCAAFAAHERRGLTGEPWQVCMSDALAGTWDDAKADRDAGIERPRTFVSVSIGAAL